VLIFSGTGDIDNYGCAIVVVNTRNDMEEVDLEALDLATLSWLTGSAANEFLLQAIRSAGHPQLRISHGYVFQLLVDGPRAIGEIAQDLGVTQQAASKSVAELTSLGYLSSVQDEQDARVRRVALSNAGRKAVTDARAARAKLERKLVKALGTNTVQTARKALIKLLEASGGVEAARQRRSRPAGVE